MTVDHNGGNAAEVERINKKHSSMARWGVWQGRLNHAPMCHCGIDNATCKILQCFTFDNAVVEETSETQVVSIDA